MRRLGKIKLSDKLLLKWLDYEDAIIRDVDYSVEHQTIDIILESVEMPIVKDGDNIPIIVPVYTLDNGIMKRVK